MLFIVNIYNKSVLMNCYLINNMVDSPCTMDCELDNGICSGCGRTRNEIVVWSSLTNEEKQKIIDRVCD